jgi:hypothetical protein
MWWLCMFFHLCVILYRLLKFCRIFLNFSVVFLYRKLSIKCEFCAEFYNENHNLLKEVNNIFFPYLSYRHFKNNFVTFDKGYFHKKILNGFEFCENWRSKPSFTWTSWNFYPLLSVIVMDFDIPYKRRNYNSLVHLIVSEGIGAEEGTVSLLVKTKL